MLQKKNQEGNIGNISNCLCNYTTMCCAVSCCSFQNSYNNCRVFFQIAAIRHIQSSHKTKTYSGYGHLILFILGDFLQILKIIQLSVNDIINVLTEIYAKDRLKRDSVKEPLTPAEYRRLQPYVMCLCSTQLAICHLLCCSYLQDGRTYRLNIDQLLPSESLNYVYLFFVSERDQQSSPS